MDTSQQQGDVIVAWRDKAFDWSVSDPLLGGVIQKTLELMMTVDKHGPNAPKLDLHVRQLERIRLNATEDDGRRNVPLRSLVYGMAESFGAMLVSLIAKSNGGRREEEHESRHLPDIKQELLFAHANADNNDEDVNLAALSPFRNVLLPKTEGARLNFNDDAMEGSQSAMDDDDDSVCIIDDSPRPAAVEEAPGPSQPRVRETSSVDSAISKKRKGELTSADRPKRRCESTLYGYYEDMYDEAGSGVSPAEDSPAAAAAVAANGASAAAAAAPQIRCEVCNKAFKSEHGLRKHRFVHSGVQCPFCHKFMADHNVLTRHVAQFHSEVPGTSGLAGPSGVPQNERRPEDGMSTGEKNFPCELCGKTFTTKKLYWNHQLTHSGVSYKCSHCEATRTSFTVLKVHMRTAHGLKPYQCEECGEMFERKSEETAHRRAGTCKSGGSQIGSVKSPEL